MILSEIKYLKKSYTNIKSLKDDPQILDSFSMKLDEILADEPHINDVNTFEQSFTESIRQANDDVIPKSTNSSRPCPWTNINYVNPLEQRRKCKDPVHLRESNLSIKKNM